MTTPGGVTGTDAIAAADERVAAFGQLLARMSLEDLSQTILPASSARDRDDARAEAERIAAAHGLATVLQEAREAVRAYVLRVFGEGLYRPTMVGLNWGVSEGTTDDRVATLLAAEDAVTAVVVEPYAPESLLVELEGGFEVIGRGHPVQARFTLTDPGPTSSVPPRGPWWWVAATALVVASAIAAWLSGIWGLIVVLVMGVLLLRRRGTS